MAESESSELLDVSSYEGWNMLDSEIFRTRETRWVSANLDMREWKAFWQQPYLERGPCRFWFHVPSEEERDDVMDILEELNLSENINETLLLPKAGKMTWLNVITEDWEESYFLTRTPNANWTANVFHPTAEWSEMLQMAIKNAISVRWFKNTPVVPTTAWERITPWWERPRLPLAYQEVAYIEGTGTQYLDTGVSAPNWFKTELRVLIVSQVNQTLIGSHNVGTPYWRNNVNTFTVWSTWGLHMNDEMINSLWSINLWQIYEIEGCTILWASYLTVDWVRLTTGTNTSPMSSNNILLLQNQYWLNHGDVCNRARIYSCKMYNDSLVLVRDFVPCYRRIDWAIWLYDLVNNQFYGNAWTWVFLKWADVRVPSLPQEYTEVEYLQSNWNQYIDTLIDRDEILTPFIRYEFQTDSSQSWSVWFLWDWTTWWYIFWFSENQYRFVAWWTQWWSSSWISYSTWRHTFRTNASNWYLDWTQGSWNPWNMTIYRGSIHLFRAANFWIPSWNVRVYSFILWSSLTELLHYFVPCVRGQDWKPWFYDLITKQFYVNNWTGEFTYWWDMVRWYKNNEYTILYWPLSWASNDVSWFRNDWTAWGISYSLTDWVKAASFVASSSNIYTDNSFVANCNWTQQFTYALWFKIWVMPASGKTYEFWWCGKNQYWDCDKLFRIASDWSLNCYNYVSTNYGITTPAWTVTTNTWYCMVYTYDWVKVRVYLNKELVWEVAAPWSYNYGNDWGWRFILWRINWNTTWFQWYVWDVVIENIWRWEDWVDKYYQNTSGRYTQRKWLSMRYIRNSMSWNNLNTSNHWVEIEAMNWTTNVALQKTVTLVSGTYESNDINRIVDWNKVADNYYSTRNWAATIQIDLWQIYKINEINMRHYFTDSRYYYSNNLQASPDWVNWTTLFNSDITWTYNELPTWKTVLL